MPPQLTRLDTGVGMLGDVPDLTLQHGQLTEEAALLLTSRLRELIRKTNRDISLGGGVNGYRAGNLDAQFIDINTTPAVANTEFVVIHGLQRVPVGYLIVRADKACNVYDSSAGSWTESLLYLKCDTAGVTIKIVLF